MTASTKQTTSIVQNPWILLFVALLSGTGGSAGLRLLAPPRVDPWTKTDDALQDQVQTSEMRQWVINYIRDNVPPPQVKKDLADLKADIRSLRETDSDMQRSIHGVANEVWQLKYQINQHFDRQDVHLGSDKIRLEKNYLKNRDQFTGPRKATK